MRAPKKEGTDSFWERQGAGGSGAIGLFRLEGGLGMGFPKVSICAGAFVGRAGDACGYCAIVLSATSAWGEGGRTMCAQADGLLKRGG